MDFTSINEQLTFTSSPMELCRNISIQDDLIIEGQQEQFGVVLLTSDPAVQIQFSRQNARVNISESKFIFWVE